MKDIKTLVLDIAQVVSALVWIIISNYGDFYKFLGCILFIMTMLIWANHSKTAKKVLKYLKDVFDNDAKKLYGDNE